MPFLAKCKKKVDRIKAGPPWFEFLVIFDVFAPWYRKRREAFSVKVYKKIRRKSWSDVPPKLLTCIRFLYKVVHKIGRLRNIARNAIATYTKFFFFSFEPEWIFFFPAATCRQWGPMVVTHTLSFSFLFRKCTQQAHIRHYGPERWRNILCKKPNLARESPATTPQNAREQGARKSNKSACMAHTKRLSSPTHLHFLLPFSLESVDRSWKGTIDWFPGG